MTKLRTLITAATVSCAFVGGVIAQDAAYDWTGFYAGVHLGAANGSSDISHMFEILNNGADRYAARPGVAGFLGGAQFGALQQWDAFVLGAEQTLELGNISGTGEFAYYDNTSVPPQIFPDAGTSGTITSTWRGSTAVKLGYAMDAYMPYVLVGLAYSNVTINATPSFGTPNMSGSQMMFGYTLGAGLSVMVADNISVFGEVRHTNYGTADFATISGVDTDQYRVSMSNNSARIGANFHF